MSEISDAKLNLIINLIFALKDRIDFSRNEEVSEWDMSWNNRKFSEIAEKIEELEE